MLECMGDFTDLLNLARLSLNKSNSQALLNSRMKDMYIPKCEKVKEKQKKEYNKLLLKESENTSIKELL